MEIFNSNTTTFIATPIISSKVKQWVLQLHMNVKVCIEYNV